MSNDLGNLGIVIKTLRVEKGLTQEAFAQKLSLTPQAVSKWENGISYPDITMLPAIADTLGVSIEELFGRESKSTHEQPADESAEYDDSRFDRTVDGVPLVYSYGGKGLYSTVKLTRIDGANAEFEDGSSADFSSSTIVNNGKGRIFFAYIENEETTERHGFFSRFKYGYPAKRTTRHFNGGVIDSIDMELAGSMDVEIVRGNGEGWTMDVEAGERFFEYLHISEEKNCLSVKTKGLMGNIGHVKMTLNCGFSQGEGLKLSISGSGQAQIAPDFETSVLSIAGSGQISANKLGNTSITISGSGDVYFEEAEGYRISVSGSGDVNGRRARGMGDIKIAGSGDIILDEVTGNLDTSVSGSGDIYAAGTLESLKLRMTGGGDFNGEKLCVNNADISLRGAADAVIGAINGRSVENVDRMCSLEVKNRR